MDCSGEEVLVTTWEISAEMPLVSDQYSEDELAAAAATPMINTALNESCTSAMMGVRDDNEQGVLNHQCDIGEVEGSPEPFHSPLVMALGQIC